MSQERQGLIRLLRTQAAVRVHLGGFLQCRRDSAGDADAEAAVQERTPPPESEDSARLKSAVAGLVRTFADQHKAQDLLGKLR